MEQIGVFSEDLRVKLQALWTFSGSCDRAVSRIVRRAACCRGRQFLMTPWTGNVSTAVYQAMLWTKPYLAALL